MINSSIEELFNSIENSSLYKEYKKMEDILNKDESIRELLDRIKELEKDATYLEYKNDPKYIEVDKEINRLLEELNNKPIYQEYLKRMEEFNEEISMSSRMISDYVEGKV